jgi:sugar lactone lactonase YvrE
MVVGDDGSLVELDEAGRPVRSVTVGGNPENVAMHSPTGDLVLLMELDLDGRLQAQVPVPGAQQEGPCLDTQGTLWVADDRAGRLRRLPRAQESVSAVTGTDSYSTDVK